MFTFPIAFFSSSGGGGGDTYTNYYSNEFDGSNDYVDLGTELNSMFELGDSFSISVWIKFGNTATDRTIVSNLTSGTKGFQLRLRPTEQVRWGIAQTPSVYGVVDTSVLAIDTWHHIVATYDGTNVTGLKLYVNGSLDTGTLDSAGTILDITNTESIKIGKYASGQLYAGNIDEVAIFDSELSASDVTAIYNSGSPDSLASQSNLKGWWRMGDGANYPIVKNQAHFSQTALKLDGVNESVACGKVSDIFGTTCNKFSISFWSRPESWYNYDSFLGTATTNAWTDGIGFYADSAYIRFWVNHYSTNVARCAYAVQHNLDKWVHVVGVYDGTLGSDNIKVYVNGSVGDQHDNLTANVNATSNLLILGRVQQSVIHAIEQSMDDVFITSEALSASDVTNIYNSGFPKDESGRSNILAYYKFDGDTYPVVRDAMQFSNASLDFDGVNDYIDLNNGASVNPSSIVSLSCWVKFDALSNYDGIFGKRMGTSVTMPFLLSLDNTSKIRFRTAQSNNTNKEIYTNSAVSTNTWYHVVAVADGTNIKLYLDGTLQTDTDTYDGTLKQSTTNNVFIGKNASDYLNGKVSDAIIFSSALSASDVTSIYNSGKPKDESSLSNILGYWRIGDNTILQHVPSALGYGTHSVQFDGASEFISVPHSASLNITGAISISAWVKWDGGSDEALVTKEGFPVSGDFKRGWALWAEGYSASDVGPTFVIWSSATAYSVDAGSNLTSGEWSHVVAVFEPSTSLKVYVNGSLAATNTTSIPATMDSTTAAITIGRFTPAFSSGYLFGGNIKDMAIFNTDLSASDVTALYNSGLPKDLSSESDLVSYWRMGDGEDKYPNILDYKGTNHGTMTNMASDNITTENVGSGYIWSSPDIVADSPAGTSGQMTNMASDNFVAAKDAGTMTNMDAEDIVTTTP